MSSVHESAAQWFMKMKGYSDVKPVDIEKLEDQPCWYFVYELEEGVLELEVFWNGSDWDITVTTFNLYSDDRALPM